MTMNLKDRIGIDLGKRASVEDGIDWAVANGVYFLDIKLDWDPNRFDRFDEARAANVRAQAERHGIHIGIHTESAVNVAEHSPIVGDAADAYLRAYMDAYTRLGAEWMVVHAGYHFGDKEVRMAASLERLRRAAEYAEKNGVQLLLESMNREPDDAEVHYLGYNVEECRYYFENLQSPNLNWSFTINHAHLTEEGIDGFLDVLDLGRCREVRVADCHRLGKEEHLRIGEGDLPFGPVLRRIESSGYQGHYTNAFGTLEDMLEGRERLVEAFESA